MRFRKPLSAILMAAMLTSVLATVGAVQASADKAATVDGIDPADFSSYTTYDGDDLGATYTKEATTFKVWAPTSTNVKLKLYATGSDTEEGAKDIATHDMTLDKKTGVWSVTVDGDLKNTYYTYQVTNEMTPKGKEGHEVVDLYAKAAGVEGDRAMVVDLDSTDPAGWDNDQHVLVDSPTEAMVWEVHVKDFSYDPESGVSDQYRGKYMAFTEFETTLNNAGDVKTCMNYLKDLGINYVQINPMYDFASVKEGLGDETQFNWGYDPKNYNVPEGSYSTNPFDGNVRITEMKEMIKALHDNGIGVIMDVVYNHTYKSQDSWFNLTVPNYYYRQTATGDWSNGSGCGNDTASEREMFKKFMVDSVSYWADEYHLDGFRFDLMGLHDQDTMNAVRDALDAMDTRILTYGEGWTMGTTTDKTNWAGNKTGLCTQAKASKINERIGFFNDDIRDSLKGKAYNDLTSPGYVSGNAGAGTAKNIYQSIIGHYTTANWKTKVPGQNVVYSCCHDNQTLWDRMVASEYGSKVSQDKYDARTEKFVSGNKLSGAIVMTSQGIPFILAGEEFARTKYGDHNSYKSSPEINKLDWSRAADYADIVAYYKGLIELRKTYPGFADITHATGDACEELEAPAGVIAYNLPNVVDKSGNSWSNVVLYFNGSRTDAASVVLPGTVDAGFADGDVDGDGVVTAGDAMAILRHSIEAEMLSDDAATHADLDGDGIITAADANKALRISLELEEAPKAPATSGDGENKVYSVIVDDQTAGTREIKTVSGKVTVAPNSALILVPKDEYDRVGVKGTYENEAYLVVNHIDKSTGKTFYTTTLRGVEGQGYSTSQASDLSLEYDFDSVEGAASGKLAKGTTTVNYYYTPYPGGVGTVVIKYIDATTEKALAETVTKRARAGEKYTSDKLGFPWYKLVEVPANAEGEFTGDTTEVVYKYEPTDEIVESTIHVGMGPNTKFQPYLHVWNYYDNGNKAAGTQWPGVKLDDPDGDGWYEFTFQNGNGYNWILNDGDSSQTPDMSNAGDIWVVATTTAANVEVFDYNPDKGADTGDDTVKGTLVVKHVDETGADIIPPKETLRPVDTEYKAEALGDPWYILDETKLPDNAEGKYIDGTIEVVYTYKAVSTKEVTISVKLADGAKFKPNMYFWNAKTQTTWPGVKMTDDDQDGWYTTTIEVAAEGVYNWILNDGTNQTDDMEADGDIWIIASKATSAGIEVFTQNPDKV